MEMKEVHDRAREQMKGFCRVCPVCDGRACAGEVPGMGGLGTGSSFQANVKALANVRLNMRLIHDVKTPNTSADILGFPLSMPVMAAPIGGVSFNMGAQMSEEDYCTAVVDGCKEAGILACTGDGVPPIIIDSGLAAIKNAKHWGIPFVKPWDGKELDAKMDKVAEAGCTAIGMDIDAAGLVTLAKMGRPVSPKGPEALAEIVEHAHKADMKFVLKGIMGLADAQAALEAGCDAILVSNHGGRVLDHTPGTAEVLPGIASALKGRITILVDGGVRTGVDVFKMLALGADGVLIGRPFSIMAVGGGAEAVKAYCEKLHSELLSAMVLTGCATISDIIALHRG